MALLLAQGELKHHLIETGSKVRYDRGDFLFCRGDEVRGVFLIINGEVRLGLNTKPQPSPRAILAQGAFSDCRPHSPILLTA